MKYRIFAHAGQVTAIVFNTEHAHPVGVEVQSGETDDISTELATLAPSGVGSPWPPVKPKPKKA